MSGLARFVESLLRGRSPEPGRLDAEEAEAARAAIELSRTRDEAHAPDPDFVERLHDRLAVDLSTDPDPEPPGPEAPGPGPEPDPQSPGPEPPPAAADPEQDLAYRAPAHHRVRVFRHQASGRGTRG